MKVSLKAEVHKSISTFERRLTPFTS